MHAHPVRAKLNQLGIPASPQSNKAHNKQRCVKALFITRAISAAARGTNNVPCSFVAASALKKDPAHAINKNELRPCGPPSLVLVAGSRPKRQKQKTLCKKKNKTEKQDQQHGAGLQKHIHVDLS
jgi:hypothetical protein